MVAHPASVARNGGARGGKETFKHNVGEDEGTEEEEEHNDQTKYSEDDVLVVNMFTAVLRGHRSRVHVAFN